MLLVIHDEGGGGFAFNSLWPKNMRKREWIMYDGCLLLSAGVSYVVFFNSLFSFPCSIIITIIIVFFLHFTWSYILFSSMELHILQTLIFMASTMRAWLLGAMSGAFLDSSKDQKHQSICILGVHHFVSNYGFWIPLLLRGGPMRDTRSRLSISHIEANGSGCALQLWIYPNRQQLMKAFQLPAKIVH